MGVIVSDALPSDPLAALRELADGEAELDRLRRASVRAARAAGATWEQVGDALAMTRQSAWEYFGRETSAAIARVALSNDDLSEDDAMALAVDEVRAVRRARRSR